jgi:hypothetical protein
MQSWLVPVAVYATLFQGLLVAAKRVPRAGARRGPRLERLVPGEREGGRNMRD